MNPLADALRAGPQEDYSGGWDQLSKLVSGLWGSSWLEQAAQEAQRSAEAYQRGGVPAMMADTRGTQDLAGGFVGSTTRSVGGKAKAAVDALGGALPEAKPLGAYPSTQPQRILDQTKDGGYSVHLQTGDVPQSGLMMGKYANGDPRTTVVPTTQLGVPNIEAHAQTNAAQLAKPDMYLGTWTDDGKAYLDVSRRFEPDQLRQATKFGEGTGQLSGYDVGNKQTFPVGNWDAFINSPEFVDRMNRFAKTGTDYMQAQNTKSWWPLPGSSIERVYGSENLPQASGYIAATAPNSAPRPNVQVASEYLRRQMAGEPIVQPDWRAGPGLMTYNEGAQMPMEVGRANNLNKAARGDLNAMQRDKVQNEALALAGDPNAVVLDRIWARLGEAPERGIFTNPEEGVISGKAYGTMKNAVVKAAEDFGQTPADFSAHVWTGVREHIKANNELYGTPYKGSAMTGESKSYVDHFDDLVRDKAKHLGISVPEMEGRLRKGDANLLSALISTPVGYAIFDQYRRAQSGNASTQ